MWATRPLTLGLDHKENKSRQGRKNHVMLDKVNWPIWSCPDLTDSGLRVKNPRNPHENTVIKTCSVTSEVCRPIQTRSAGIMARQRPQCGPSGNGAGNPPAVALPLGAANARQQKHLTRRKFEAQRGRIGK